MSAWATPEEILAEAKLLYSKLTPPRKSWDKLKYQEQKQKYLDIAAFTANREKAHQCVITAD